MRRSTVLATIVLACLAGSAAAAPAPLPEVAVTTCGQIVPRKTLGYLTSNLDCSGYTGSDPDTFDAGAAVTLSHKSKLDLRGFTLTAGIHGVLCDNLRSQGNRHGCEVFGGTVTGAVQRGIGGGAIYVHNVTATSNAVGIYAYARGRIEDVVVDASTDDGIRSGRAKVARATVTNNAGNGITSTRVTVRDSSVTGNAIGGYCTSHPGDCGDLHSDRTPKVVNTVCGTSVGSGGNPPTWGVCSND